MRVCVIGTTRICQYRKLTLDIHKLNVIFAVFSVNHTLCPKELRKMYDM